MVYGRMLTGNGDGKDDQERGKSLGSRHCGETLW
jgi:hypothetical protein